MENRQYGWLLALRGLLAIAFGLAALAWPGITLVTIALLFGAYALVDGVGSLISFFRRRVPERYRAAHLVAGVAAVGAGVLTLLWPAITALALTLLIGAWAVVIGVLDIVAATSGRGEWWVGLIGALTIAAGMLVLLRPAVSALFIAQVIGVYAIIIGVLRLVETWQLHRTPGRRGGYHAPARA